jgi:hypothetical protein
MRAVAAHRTTRWSLKPAAGTQGPVDDSVNPRSPEGNASTAPDGMTGTAAPRNDAVRGSKAAASTAPSLAKSRWPVDDHTGVVARSTTTDRGPPSIEISSIRSPPGSVVRLANSTRRSPGNTSGCSCSTSWRAASSTVSGRGVPPSGETSGGTTRANGCHDPRRHRAAPDATTFRCWSAGRSRINRSRNEYHAAVGRTAEVSAPSGYFAPPRDRAGERTTGARRPSRPPSTPPDRRGRAQGPCSTRTWVPRRAGTRCRNASSRARSCRHRSGPREPSQPAAP